MKDNHKLIAAQLAAKLRWISCIAEHPDDCDVSHDLKDFGNFDHRPHTYADLLINAKRLSDELTICDELAITLDEPLCTDALVLLNQIGTSFSYDGILFYRGTKKEYDAGLDIFRRSLGRIALHAAALEQIAARVEVAAFHPAAPRAGQTEKPSMNGDKASADEVRNKLEALRDDPLFINAVRSIFFHRNEKSEKINLQSPYTLAALAARYSAELGKNVTKNQVGDQLKRVKLKLYTLREWIDGKADPGVLR